MKIEFNSGEFNANMNCDLNGINNIDLDSGKKVLQENSSLIFSVLSLLLALANLPFGLFMNLSTELLNNWTERGLEHWISVLLVATTVLTALSVICGVIAVVLFAKSEKRTTHYVGLSLAITSFVLCAVCLTLNIAGMIVW